MKNQFSRRNFLKNGAMAVGAIAAVGVLSKVEPVMAATQGGSGTMKNSNASLSGQFLIGGDLKVNRLGYGALKITGPGVWGEPERRPEAIQLLRRLPELGVNFIDTADAYGPFISEELIAEALAPYKGFPYAGLVIGTKGGFVRPDDVTDPWVELGEPNYLQQCVRMSLRRLKLDRIDLWQLHRVDPKVSQDTQYKAIRSFMDKGLIRHAALVKFPLPRYRKQTNIFLLYQYKTATTSSREAMKMSSITAKTMG